MQDDEYDKDKLEQDGQALDDATSGEIKMEHNVTWTNGRRW